MRERVTLSVSDYYPGCCEDEEEKWHYAKEYRWWHLWHSCAITPIAELFHSLYFYNDNHIYACIECVTSHEKNFQTAWLSSYVQ